MRVLTDFMYAIAALVAALPSEPLVISPILATIGAFLLAWLAANSRCPLP